MFCKLVLFVLVLHCVTARNTLRVIRSSKDLNQDKTNPEDLPCELNDPCAWAVYVRATRKVDYYVYNCVCIKPEVCTKYKDDLTSQAYVYKCKLDDTLNNTSTTVATTVH